MTVPAGDTPGSRGGLGSDVGVAPSDRANDPAFLASRAICPYLLSADGAWLSAEPSRDHRCTAVVPAAQLAAEKQRRVCLTSDHLSCATFLAARDVHGGQSGSREAPPWRLARPVPVVLDHGLAPATIVARARDRGIAQAALVVLMVAAFVTVFLARGLAPSDRSPAGAAGSPSFVPAASPTPAPSPSPSASPTPAPSPPPSASASPAPSPSATPASSSSPSAATTYRVQPGDTLTAIAARFGTTVKAIQELNGIDDPSVIRVGQLLTIP